MMRTLEPRQRHLAIALALPLIVAAQAGLSQAPPPFQPFGYTVKDLGTLCISPEQLLCGIAGSRAFGLNNWAEVVGISHVVSGGMVFPSLVLRGFRTAPGQAIHPADDELGFGGPGVEFRAYGINDGGSAVGAMDTVFGLPPNVAELSYGDADSVAAFIAPPNGGVVLFPAAAVLDCPPTPPRPFGCHRSIAFAINNQGAIVGGAAALLSLTSATPHHAFRLSAQIIEDLGTLPGEFWPTSQARGINDHGLVVGFAADLLGHRRAVWFLGGSAVDLGSLCGGEETACGSAAFAVNTPTDPNPFSPVGAGVVGESDSPIGRRHAFYLNLGLRSPAMQDLGTLCSGPDPCRSAAFGLNDVGQIIGESEVMSSSDTTHAFLYSDAQMTDLNTLLSPLDQARWELTDARGINDLGQMVGTGRLFGAIRAYLMTPPPHLILANIKGLLALALAGHPPGVERNLLAKLMTAEAALERGDFQAVLGELGAFDNHVAALMKSGALTETQGNKLLAGAALIRRILEEAGER